MGKNNPYSWTFEEYLRFHNKVMANAEKSHRPNVHVDKSMDVDTFLKSHHMIRLEDFIDEMNRKYGI